MGLLYVVQLAVLLCVGLWVMKILRVVVSYWLHRRQLFALVREPANAHWWRGHLAAKKADQKETVIIHCNKEPRRFLKRSGPLLVGVSVTHPETIAEVLRYEPPKFEFAYGMLRPLLGNGLVTSGGKRWARDRKLLLRVFTSTMLQKYVTVYKDCCSVMLDIWSTRIAAGDAKTGIRVSDFLPLLTFDIILRCAMGVEAACQTETDKSSPVLRYYHSVHEVTAMTSRRYRQPWFFSDFIFYLSPTGRRYRKLLDETFQFSEKLIAERRDVLKNAEDGVSNSGHELDMLDILLTVRDENGVGLTDTEIREQVDTFLFAGQDTTSTVLQWAIYYFSRNADIQEKCRDEVSRVIGECGGLEAFKHEHINDLQYVTETVQEVLRHASVVPFVSRSTAKPTKVDGIELPPDTYCQINIMGVHHNKQIWTDPEKFNPDRFSPGNAPRHSHAFVPFSAGPRSCIGKQFALDELRVVLSMLLLRFRISPDPEAVEPHWEAVLIGKPSPYVSVRLEEL